MQINACKNWIRFAIEKILIEILKEEVKPVVTDVHDIQDRDKSLLLAVVSGECGLFNFQCMDQSK